MTLVKPIITIDDLTFSPPTKWTVNHGQIAYNWKWDDDKSMPYQISELCNVDIKELLKLDIEDLREVWAAVFSTYPVTETNYNFDWNLDMNWGKWVDLEVLTSKGVTNNFKAICDTLLGLDTFNYPLSSGHKLVTDWITYRSNVYKSYSVLFGIDENSSTDHESDIAPEKIWYAATVALSGDRFHILDYITQRSVNECLNWLSYQKDKSLEEERKTKAMNKKLNK